jgi:hypothetical protein
MLTTSEIAKAFSRLNKTSLPEREIDAVYCCDLLSAVMGGAPEGSAWITIMSNINVIAVASLTEVACVIIAAGSMPDEIVIAKADEQGVHLFASADPIFETALSIHARL